jgi:tRNA(Ile)-lysidine synthase
MIVAAVRAFLTRYEIGPCRIVVAVSGGADSTGLLVAMNDLLGDGFEVFAAHVNHRLRGEESDADEEFVREICARLAIPLETVRGELDPERVRARGIEAAAREIRYARLLEIRDRIEAPFLATAHQKDDQAETVLMRLITGGGIAALRGIHPCRADGVIRPLLDVTRAEIESFLRERGITPRLDSSNQDPRFLRNRVRLFLRELGASGSLSAIAAQAQSCWPLLERAVDEAERESADISANETRFVRLPGDPWLRQALLHRHIRRLDSQSREISAKDLIRLAAEADAIRRVSVTRSLELVRSGDALLLRRSQEPDPEPPFEVELTENSPAFIPSLGISVHLARASDALDPGNRQRIEIGSAAEPRFIVRNRREGDRFQPLGMKGSKKLKELLIDRKIAAERRDRLPLLVLDGEIVWIAGVEVSERFKVTGSQGIIYEVWTED